MKTTNKIINYILLSALCISTFSCKKGFNEVNTDPIGKSKVTANQLLAPALVNILSANMVRNRNFNNELMQVTVDISDAEGKVFRYDVRRNWADYTWNTWYPELTNLRDIYTISNQPESLNASYKGISLITQAWTFQLLTDVYGDVPYSEANQGKEGNYEPVFDKQKDIYLDLFTKLEEANKLLSEGKQIVSTGDPVYQGDVNKWRRLGNSLYLRLLLRVAGKAEVSAQVIAKIKEIADTNKANYPIMENNTHTAKILWNGTNSSTAVYSSPFMINVRAVDFRTPAISAFFIDNLRNWADPRINPTFGKGGVNRFGIAPGPIGYSGVPSGYDAGTSITKQAYFYSDAQNAGVTLQTDPYTGIIMNVAEVDFILAEAAAKGWISGTGQTYYYKGIADAINYWIPAASVDTSNPAFLAYLTAADIAWDNALPLNGTAGSASKMEFIHLQKYYALFLVDFQQWLEYRRTGYPFLSKSTGLANGGRMPVRLNYPLVTQSTNPTNYKNAVASQGADDINTLVWWQKP
ncbi:SusD/RagB family nutrient-binding outer membrane lipoprotein [Pedobacter punctiformis]|uniref:SusD/RagB family nutrient-binding outer membrane lipoprotein n=1 Tax=Pedobacter punctiformis TaxID=3004097 RepID=A0ABT4L7B6_9SPHI|nr:SusD/RagB family nutrient-binding outer membrane lipoprotein [Pedobacter sp. HCMS5-2]MCZ4243807.1 SusD/RagB family nutrient-binding outer membrane lipoprotein [Pedobacter sp. HCMS5-2]